MSDTKEALVAARNEGRAAAPGTPNPYAGRGLTADAWQLGYKTMLLDKLNRSPARQAFLYGDEQQ